LQAAYEEFGCNTGNTYFIGIDKGSNNEDVIAFDSIYGVHYPGVSGNQGGGNIVHLLYDVQSTPSVVVILPDRSIAVKQVYPPAFQLVVDSVQMAGGMLQECMTTGLDDFIGDEHFFVSPNPVRQKATLHFDLYENDVLAVRIYNASGRMVRWFHPEIFRAGKQTMDIDFSGLERGIYFVNVINQKGTQLTRKIILTP
jgi:hypothetical protein